MAWFRWKQQGILPRDGGWFDQPLRLIVQMLAIDRVHSAWVNKMDDDFPWSRFTANELKMIVEIEKELTESG